MHTHTILEFCKIGQLGQIHLLARAVASSPITIAIEMERNNNEEASKFSSVSLYFIFVCLQSAQSLHGDIPQKQRELTLKGFRNGAFDVLVATNVAARGLDIPEVDLVVQCSPPKV